MSEQLVQELSKTPWPAYASVAIEGEVFLFMLPRKCASNTVKHALSKLASSVAYLMPEELRGSMAPRIAVVRHPVARLISCWRHGVVKNQAQYMRQPGVRPEMPWSEFVDLVCNTGDEASNYHFRSYSDELLPDGRFPDWVLKTESLEKDWRRLATIHGWPQVELGRLNASSGPPLEVTRAQLARLATRYEKDAINFGYGILEFDNRYTDGVEIVGGS